MTGEERWGTVVAVTNLGARGCTIDLSAELPEGVELLKVFANRTYGADESEPDTMAVDGRGYRWLRLR